MARSGLIDLVTYERYYKFCKQYKEQYKKENGKELETDVLTEITFGKLFKTVNKLSTVTNEDGTVEKKIVQVQEPRMVQLEDCVVLVKLDSDECTDEKALLKIQRYFEKPENKNIGLNGLHLDLCCDVHKDLPFIAGAYKRACTIRDKYRDEINKQIENTTVETDTQE